MQPKLYHMGIKSKVSRSTLAEANEKRDWRIYADFAQILIAQARELYKQEEFEKELDETVYALDATTIDLCLSLFPWAKFRKHKGGIKLHTLLDVQTSIPTFIELTPAKVHEVNILDIIIPEAGAFYVMDRAYIDFARLYRLHLSNSFFVIRAKSNINFKRIYSHPVDRTTGVLCDQTISLTGFYPSKGYPDKLRQIKYHYLQRDMHLVFITNNFRLQTLLITKIFKERWQIELFFKWIKQHLRIKSFYGTKQNAVKKQIWIAISVYLLVIIAKKRLNINLSLYTFLQILSISIFKKSSILELANAINYRFKTDNPDNQLNLFNL
jgi:DNA polymerase III delta prime subunit